MKIKFLYGSETGSAEVLAMDMADNVDSHTGDFANVEGLDDSIFNSDDDLYVFVIATYGEGDYPVSAEDFFEDLENSAPDLSNIKYACFGLGDSAYEETFNFAIKNTDKLMQKLGATRIGDVGLFDASSGDLPEDEGLPWVENLISNI